MTVINHIHNRLRLAILASWQYILSAFSIASLFSIGKQSVLMSDSAGQKGAE